MANLRRGLAPIFDLLTQHEKGETLSRAEIMKATGWKDSTLDTYLRKNKLAGFLAPRSDGRFDVLRSGKNVKKEDVAGALTQVTPDTTRFATGEKLSGVAGKYRLISEIGRGATAHVWKAAEAKTGNEVAVKIVNPRPDLLAPSILSDLMSRFRREAGNGAKIAHDCIIKHLDSGSHRGRPFLVMELAERSVLEMLTTDGKVSAQRAREVVARCASGLGRIHESGCVHRDVKPANMLITSRGVVLGDLGIVRWSDLNPEFTSAGTITTAAINLGSLNYMAPEQRDAPHQVGPLSDVYSLGVSWYQLLTNELPSAAAFAADAVRAPSVLEGLNRIIHSMTRYSPSKRPSLQSVVQFLDAFTG